MTTRPDPTDSMTIRPDPPRSDRCATCGKPMPVVNRLQRRYAGEQITLDPFCDTRCARVWHGCELPVVVPGKATK